MPKRQSTEALEAEPSKKGKARTSAPAEHDCQGYWLSDLQNDIEGLKQERRKTDLKIMEMEELISKLQSSIAKGMQGPDSKLYYIVRSSWIEDNLPCKMRTGDIKGIYTDLETANKAAIMAYKSIRAYDNWRKFPVSDRKMTQKSLEGLHLKDGETIRATTPSGTHLYKFRNDEGLDGWVSVTPYECYSAAYVNYLAEISTNEPLPRLREERLAGAPSS